MTHFAWLPRSTVVHVLRFADSGWATWCSSLEHPIRVRWRDGRDDWTHGTNTIYVTPNPRDLPAGHRLCRACQTRLAQLTADVDAARTAMNPTPRRTP